MTVEMARKFKPKPYRGAGRRFSKRDYRRSRYFFFYLALIPALSLLRQGLSLTIERKRTKNVKDHDLTQGQIRDLILDQDLDLEIIKSIKNRLIVKNL